MQVYKFGGASVKDADAIKNVAAIVSAATQPLVVVVSAMGKTTNGLEAVVNAGFYKNGDSKSLLDAVIKFHQDILQQLFEATDDVFTKVNNFWVEIAWALEEEPRSYGFLYDQIVSIGELVATTIIAAYLNRQGTATQWLDARSLIFTDNNYRQAQIQWPQTVLQINQIIAPVCNQNKVALTQGFIGGTSENYTTTLGREGSDYTAAIIAYCLDAQSVTIWKDVSGVLNADPKFFSDAQKLEQLSYHDAIELTYYGATVIHPKTIKPLENKGIPLYVKSFVKPEGVGTVIGKDLQTKPFIPSYIFKSNQVLISIGSKDFSFIAEAGLSHLFGLFAAAGVKINLMQNSAISFSVCVDDDAFALPALLESLKADYRVLFNNGLVLYTIRHYNQFTIDKLLQKGTLILEQRSRNTAQLIMYPNAD
ncbi:MAG: aspartate kinase [Bacteroidia bacterium]|nr:aspartate kinase [Bacteroidia bacterium]HQU99711.1 aspartate kinase [Bacteroidia bacterium]